MLKLLNWKTKAKYKLWILLDNMMISLFERSGMFKIKLKKNNAFQAAPMLWQRRVSFGVEIIG